MNGRCPNCGTPAPEEYCPRCGQSQSQKVLSLWRLTADFFDEQLALDSRLPRTLVPLLFHPGLLTREYLDGRIARYFAPFRIYLIASLVFFLLLSLRTPEYVRMTSGDPDATATVDSLLPPVDSPDAAPDRNGEVPDTSADPVATDLTAGDTLLGQTIPDDIAPSDSQTGDPGPALLSGDEQVQTGSETLDRLIRMQIRKFAGLSQREVFDRVNREMLRQAPKAMFLLLPAFALLLKLLYFRSGRLYAEHFIFALHVHAFWFLGFSLLLFLPSGWIERAVWLWTVLYLLFALRRVYSQGWLKTGAKYGALGCGYWIIITIAMVVVALLAIVLA